MARCLVTGAGGFVGRQLAGELRARGVAVRALLRRPAAGPWDEQVQVDLGAGPLPAGLLDGVDTVFHLAGRAHAVAELGAGDEAYAAATVSGTAALLEAAAAAGVRGFVFCSSVKAAGGGGSGSRPADETDPAPPTTPYGRAKAAAERLVLAAGERDGLHVCNLRPALVYGPGCKGNLARMLQAIDRGRFPPPPAVANRRSMVAAPDLVAALLAVAERPQAAGRTYIVTDGHAYSTRELYLAMAAALGRRPAPPLLPCWALRLAARAGDAAGRLRGRRVGFDSTALERLVGSAWYSSARLSREVGFAPRWRLAAALPAMVAAHRAGALSP